MTDKTIEWNLGFAYKEVIERLEKLLTQARYVYTRAGTHSEMHFQVALSQGTLELHARPLRSHRSPFSSQIILHRTLLTMTFAGASADEEQTFLQRLTLAFLRVGG